MAEMVTEAATAGVGAGAASAPAVGSAELPQLRDEGERENAQLRAELGKRAPWWRKATTITTLTAIIAAVLPVTTAVQAHYQKERELVLQESNQAHAIRTGYLDRLDKPGAKLRTLRFVLATANDPALETWAKEEMKVVQAELNDIERKIAALESQNDPPSADGRHEGSGGAVAGGGPAAAEIPKQQMEKKRSQKLRRLREQLAASSSPQLGGMPAFAPRSNAGPDSAPSNEDKLDLLYKEAVVANDEVISIDFFGEACTNEPDASS
jgi:hypothetical protein